MSSKKFTNHSYVESGMESTNDEEIIDDNLAINLDSKEFKQKLWECLFWSAGMEGLDAYILRFLVGRKGKIIDALKMLLNTLIWRVTYDIEGLCREGERIIDENEFSCGKVYFHKFDKQGRYVTYIHMSKHIKDVRPQIETEKMTILSMETVRLILNKDVPCACMVFDMTGFSMQNFDYGFVRFLLSCFQGHYPDNLGIALIVGAPWIFQGCWKIIKQLLDPIVANKIRFLKDKSEIKEYINETDIPECLGGTGKYNFEYIPYKEEDDVKASEEEIAKAKRNWDIAKNKFIKGIYEKYSSQLNVKLEDLLFKIDNGSVVCDDTTNVNEVLEKESTTSSSVVSAPSSVSGNDSLGVTLKSQIENNLYNTYVEYDKLTRSRTVYHRLGITHY